MARFGQEVVRLGRDRLAPRGAFPHDIDVLDAPYLRRVMGAPVDRVEVLTTTDGTTDRALLGLEGVGVPPSVFVKMAPTAAVTRLFVNLSDLGADEIGFYRDVRPTLDLEAPQALGAAVDPTSKRFVLVLEDLAAQGATFGEVLAEIELPSVEAVLDTMAVLHGSCWRTSRLDDRAGAGSLGWVRANSGDPMLPLVTAAVRSMGKRLARRDAALAPLGAREILRRYPAVARELDAGPHTLLHGDPHPGNCYFLDGRAGLLDWQVIRRGHPLRDVTYFLTLALEPDVRRAHERNLLDRYRAALAAAGGPALSADEAWTMHRKMAAYPYVATTFTAGLGGLQAEEVGLAGLRRAVAAVTDLDTVGALRSLT